MKNDDEHGNLPLLIFTILLTMAVIGISCWVILSYMMPFVIAFAPYTYIAIVLIVLLIAILLF
ncbi:MAG: hypothetical protein IKG11_04780 [Atopobiaceae bacterium]|nr:hypothetical protein [Atopobiaceae bacterium]